jgi:hypothetical protein
VESCRAGKIDGAEKLGKVWVCPRASWHRAKATRPAPKLTLVSSAPCDEETADRMIREAGFRFTRP